MNHQLVVRKSRRLREAAQNPKMGQDFFAYLPSEMIINILSRLPARTAMSCKCVCKSWLDLLVTPEFVKSHLSKSVPGLAVFELNERSKPYKIVEFVDELDLNCDEHRWNVVFNFNLPFHVPVYSAANGLLFLWVPYFLIICNPITRDYITLPFPLHTCCVCGEDYGFGVSRISGQYKLVRMFTEIKLDAPPRKNPLYSACQVYTVGTGSWRIIASPDLLYYDFECGAGAFLNGNLHWLAYDFKSRTPRISCFDLETELFSTFSPPPLDDPPRCRNLSVLGDCMCLCDNWENELMSGYDIDIWLMKEYGDEKSWTNEFVIREMYYNDFQEWLCPIKVFEDGDILMELDRLLCYYSNKTKTIREVDVSGLGHKVPSRAAIYAPSFVPLKAFAMENVTSF